MSWPAFLLLAVAVLAWAYLARGWAGLAVAGFFVALVSTFRLLLDRDFGEGLWAHDREEGDGGSA